MYILLSIECMAATKCGMPRLMTLVNLFLHVTFVGSYLSDERDNDEK